MPWISSTGSGRSGLHGGSARYPPATEATPARRSESSHPSRAVIPPPFETPVTKTRAESTQTAASSWSSERSMTSTSFEPPGTAPLMFQNEFAPPADG